MTLAKTVLKDAGYYLRHFRATHDFTAKEAAEYFRVSQSMWSLMERGLRVPNRHVAHRLAAATGAPLEVLLQLTRPRRVKVLGGRPADDLSAEG